MRPSNKTFSDISKSSASMYESSDSQFFRIITGIKSGPNIFGESRSMIYRSIMQFPVSSRKENG